MKAPASKTWNALLELNAGRWGCFLLCLAIAAHAYSIAVTGAKFWIDSIAYFELALALFDAGQLGRLYIRDLASSTSTLSRACRF